MAIVERFKQESMYGLPPNKSGRCGEVAVSEGLTVERSLKNHVPKGENVGLSPWKLELFEPRLNVSVREARDNVSFTRKRPEFVKIISFCPLIH